MNIQLDNAEQLLIRQVAEVVAAERVSTGEGEDWAKPLLFRSGRLQFPGELDVIRMRLFKRPVQLATHIPSHGLVHLLFAAHGANTMCRNKALEHQVDDVRRAESWVQGTQPVNAIEQLGIEAIGDLPLAHTLPPYTSEIRCLPLYTTGV